MVYMALLCKSKVYNESSSKFPGAKIKMTLIWKNHCIGLIVHKKRRSTTGTYESPYYKTLRKLDCIILRTKFLRTKYFESEQTNLCFLLRGSFGGSKSGSLNTLIKIGLYFLNITVDTENFLSSLSTLDLKDSGRFAMSAHFFILLKNWMRLQNRIDTHITRMK